jgi:hypothetical protein
MKKLLLFFIFVCVANSYDLTQFYKDYKEKRYLDACKKGVNIFNEYKEDEDYLTVYSFACLKSDMIDRLAVPVTGLRKTKEARANASYFSAILLQKKLLYHAVVDGVDISGLKLPTTDFVLSRVFDMYSNKQYLEKEGTYTLNDDETTYKMFVIDDDKFKKLIIQQLKNGNVVSTHTYF